MSMTHMFAVVQSLIAPYRFDQLSHPVSVSF